MKEKTPMSHEVACFQIYFETTKSNYEFSTIRGKLHLSRTTFTLRLLEGAVSHNVLFYQHLSITRYQVRFYVNNYLNYQ